MEVFLEKDVREAAPNREGKRVSWRNKKARDFTHFLIRKSTLLSTCTDSLDNSTKAEIMRYVVVIGSIFLLNLIANKHNRFYRSRVGRSRPATDYHLFCVSAEGKERVTELRSKHFSKEQVCMDRSI